MLDGQLGQELIAALGGSGRAAAYFECDDIQKLKAIRDRSELRELLLRCGYTGVDLSQGAKGIAAQMPGVSRRRDLRTTAGSPVFWATLGPPGCIVALILLPFKALFAVAEYFVALTDPSRRLHDSRGDQDGDSTS